MPETPLVLLVEDDESLRANVTRYLADHEYEVHGYPSAEEALPAAATRPYAIAIVDYRLPGMDGIEFVRTAKQDSPEMPCVMVTAHGDIQSAVEAIKAGAKRFLEKPVEPATLLETIEELTEPRRLKNRIHELRKEVDERYAFEQIVGNSPALRGVFDRIKLAAPTNSTILVTGETGTGKELVARAIHKNSERKQKPFVAVNCAALPESLIESELFGHEKGAFTGAATRKQGYFEAADGGTLFIDEIGELAPSLQAKLLRALEQRVITRVGSTTEIPVDVRIVAATHRDLRTEVGKERFREDLYYRLSVVTIELPPLRDRRGDIPLLTAHFLRQFAREHNRHLTEISDEAVDALEHYPWPGNVRELRNTLESIVVLSTSETLDLADLPAHVLRGESPEDLAETSGGASASGRAPAARSKNSYRGMTLAEIEQEAILEAIAANDGNKTQAARDLGIAVRTIQRKLAQYDNAETESRAGEA